MKVKSSANAKQILWKVLELDPAKRREFLDNAELTAEIRLEIESLLSFETVSKDFMSLPIGDFSKDFPAEVKEDEISSIGLEVGVYKIVGELGFGGMGAVYLAERTDEKFDQKVAVKMLKREFNVEKIRQTFKREKEILSKLNHPLIARLLDAGTTGDNIPYLVMEYVEGLPINKFCEAKNLSLKSRLKLFNKVCEAVSFAHRNLIIHRDLKPSNILVTENGEPKLLDFGISKLFDEEHSDGQTAFTLFGAMTPEYASPEQIKGEAVTTATDIYSLGVVLYKILTNALPFDSNGKTNGELLKVITEEEPTLPSKSERSISASDFTVAQLKGDLDNIILKSLRTEPGRRYQTVEQFAADIWRFIDGLPVLARPSTFGYRAGKFFGRNQLAVIAMSLVFLSLITGIVVSMWQTELAREAQRLSAIETEKAKTEQSKSEKITRFMSKIIGYANPAWYAEGANGKGQARVIDALEDLSDKIDTEFANEPDIAAEIHYKFGEVFHWVSKGETGARIEYFQQKRRFHVLRALELRVQFYGEWHELVAKDLFGAYSMIGKTHRERADLLMRAILMMRDTNPDNLNLPFMLEAYTARLILPEYEELHNPFQNAVSPPTNDNKYQIAEKMLRESLPIFRLHYKPDNSAIFAAECKLSYTLAMQKNWEDFAEHFAICKQYGEKLNYKRATEAMQFYVALIEQALVEKNQPK